MNIPTTYACLPTPVDFQSLAKMFSVLKYFAQIATVYLTVK